MNLEVLADDDAVALRGAAIIASDAREAVATRGRFVFAVSGGRTPWKMLRALAREDMPWDSVHVVQVDERIAPAGHEDRNFTHLRESLLELVPLLSSQVHGMPVEAADLPTAAATYARTLAEIAGVPAILDLVHLGLGPDGHTASLIPGDRALDERELDVALTGTYDGRRRMTLTLPVINRARRVLWLVTGSEKVIMLARLLANDQAIPAGRVNRERALVLADKLAAAGATPP
jgi:6-phosphogluconolactonase